MKSLLIPLLVVIGFVANAQISGIVVDTDGSPLPTASVAIYKDGTLVDGTLTDQKGIFSMKAVSGKFQIRVSFVSFQGFTVDTSMANANTPLYLGRIELQDAEVQLEEALIQGEANFMEMRQDKRIFNVSKDLGSIGSNASEILRNLPSVDVDIDGNVSLRGSANVRILIDGKPSGLIGINPADALRQLQGSMIERIEVITNPSARYEAEGDAGIINIVLKKEKRPGLNGSFEGQVGYPDNFGISGGLNYRKNKLNFFGNLNFNYRKNPGEGFSTQTFNLEDTSYSFSDTRDHLRGGSSGTIRLGADYSLAKNQTLTGTFLFSGASEDNFTRIVYENFDENGMLSSRDTREDPEVETDRTKEADLHYEKLLEGKDHKWTMDFRYQESDDTELSEIIETSEGMTSRLEQRVDNQEDEQNILFQTDYVKPLSGKRSFETGARISLREIENDYSVSERDGAGEYQTLERFTNDFIYLENIYAAYAIYNGTLGEKLTYQMGLRSEYTDLSTELRTTATKVSKKYLNLFPSTFFTWDISETGDIQISYSKRISRPRFRNLLPFFTFSNNRIFFSGNPDLDPEFTDSYEMGYLRYWGKASLYGGIYHRHRTGVIERITVVNDTGFTELFPVNLSTRDAYGLEFTYNHDIFKWWHVDANLNLYNEVTVGTYESQNYSSNNTSLNSRVTSRTNFWKSDLQIRVNYQGPRVTTQGTIKSITSMDLGWSKDILKDKGTLALNIRDVFNSRVRRSTTSGDTFYRDSRFQWRSRQLILTFTYRLNQSAKKKQGRSSGFGGEGDSF